MKVEGTSLGIKPKPTAQPPAPQSSTKRPPPPKATKATNELRVDGTRMEEQVLHSILIMVQACTFNIAFTSNNTVVTLIRANTPAQVCDVLKGLIMVLCVSMMHYVDYSMMYYLIRGQSAIKLFIIYNTSELADRLLASLGQDILDSLYWTATESKVRKRDSKKVIFHFLLAVFYVCILLAQINSSITAEHLWPFFLDFFMVICSDVVFVILKHIFTIRFNDITEEVYSEYRASLAFELVSSQQDNASTEYCDALARTMDLTPLPLAVVLIRALLTTFKVQGTPYTCVFLFYLGLVTLKVFNSIVLLGKSCVYVKRANVEDKLFEKPSTPTASS
ncbi:transmembrane anterior posterior transformation protein 1 homolog [Limanda limanda]|uniref:transmembrane anterior posterior transformation protein 1 homolog n=1 Tax=Limanda limanda TaxID=27771 RepID=UPI0029C855D8|nr:transmembrane anterior posterior transformation protein 1 homolog [Limanda limanda]